MPQLITFTDTMHIRARPDTLFRQVFEPVRRLRWDSALVEASYIEGERLATGAKVYFKWSRRLLGLSFVAHYTHIRAPFEGQWEATQPFGPLEAYAQEWHFKAVTGGCIVAVTTTASLRYKWASQQLETQLRNITVGTLLDLQRSVDAQGAQKLSGLMRQEQEKQQAEKKALKLKQRKK